MLHYKGQSEQYMLVLKKDEALVETLTEFAIEHNLKGGRIEGIGALKNVQLGYYDLEKKDYLRKTYSEDDFELISLNGNITLKDGNPYVHVHASLSGRDLNAFGGHLFEADVAVTAEVFIHTLGAMPGREQDNEIGLALICRFAD